MQGAPFNVLHVCKNNNLLFALADYPVHAINWAVGSPGNPGLREVQMNTSKTVIGAGGTRRCATATRLILRPRHE